MTSSIDPIAVLSALALHVLGALALVATMLQIGLEPQPVVDRAGKRHRRRLILRALVFNFGVVPALAFLTARAIGIAGPVVIALLLLAASPGGRYAPALVKVMRGDVPLGSEITMFMCKLNAILSPLLAAWMIGVRHVGLHELRYAVTLFALQIVPYYGGQQLRKRRPRAAATIMGPTTWIATASVVLLLAYLVAHRELRLAMLVGLRGWLATLVFGLVLLALGWLVGGRDRKVRLAFAITTEARNLALALVIAGSIVGQPAVLLATFGVWLILLLVGGAAVLLGRAPRALSARPATPAPQH